MWAYKKIPQVKPNFELHENTGSLHLTDYWNSFSSNSGASIPNMVFDFCWVDILKQLESAVHNF